MTAEGPIVVICAWNRPLYLWACLDSFYRYTKHPARFVIVDNASTDPQVREVINGFARRKMFWRVELSDKNVDAAVWAYRRYAAESGEYIVWVDSDVCVFDTEPCWLTRMINLMKDDPQLALLGSYIDTSDFVRREDVEWLAEGTAEDQFEGLIKSRSPERAIPKSDEAVIDPFNPPGRLTIMRTSIADQVRGDDYQMYVQVKAMGLKAGIATSVRHRHLSLLNVFDYPGYSMAHRDAVFYGPREP